MAKIITVTANTAIDMFIEAEGFAFKENIQATANYEFACGKGVNVAKAVAGQGVPVTCLGFVGRQSLGLFDCVDIQGLQADFTVVDGRTRTNITLFDGSTSRETHIRTLGYAISENNCCELSKKIDATVGAGDIVVFSGSLPPGAPDDLYRLLIELCHSKAAVAFLDSSGKALSEGLKAKPYLIKPNEHEFATLVGSASADEQDIIAAAHGIIAHGIKWVYVSRGARGTLAVGEQITLAGRVNKLAEKKVTAVGCGDALLAGLAVATLKELAPEDVVKTGVACGTANLFCAEPGRLDRRLLSKIFPEVAICRL